MIDVDSCAVDRCDPGAMQAERVRAMRRAGGKDALRRTGTIAARMDAEQIATSSIEPGDDDDLVAGSQALQGLRHVRFEKKRRSGRTFVGLIRR